MVEKAYGTDPEGQANEVNGDDNLDDADEIYPSLMIPIRSSSDKNLFVEIFPEEMATTSTSKLIKVLRDEQADLSTWAEAGTMYMQQKNARDALTLLEDACEWTGAASSTGGSNTTMDHKKKNERVRILAAAGIAHLAANQQQKGNQGGSGAGGSGGSSAAARQQSSGKDEYQQHADQRFTQAGKIDTFFPMTWVGRGMLNLGKGNLDQAKFFFQTTLKQCGDVMPALLGMAAVLYGEGNYKAAQAKYAETIRLYPVKSGAATRVGFGLACYKLGQVDRAKAAFARALDMDPECVNAVVGVAILDMASLDETAKDFSTRTEQAIKMMSMANILDHSNAMVQNHLANHYFWKWTPLTGTVEVTRGSDLVKASHSIPLDPGEPIRIGTKFETTVKEDSNADEDHEDSTQFRISSPWKHPSMTGLKVWKKDYERVFALAKGAYNSTSVQEIQAESLFFLARVYHVREDIDNAHKFYDKACKLAPDLSPARFGLAQTLVVKEDYAAAESQLKQLLSSSGNAATDALALLGLLEVRSGKNFDEGLSHLRKAIELDPLNADLVVLEALALQQHKSNYPKSLQRYQQAAELMKRKGVAVPYHIYANIGVLCHETKRYDESLKMYRMALEALDETENARKASLENKGIGGMRIRRPENDMFYGFVDSGLKCQVLGSESDSADGGNNKKKLKVVFDGSEATVDSHPFAEGDQIRLGESFSSEVNEVKIEDGVLFLVIKDEFDPMVTETDEAKQDLHSVFVQRENKLLEIPEATTVAFNIARLHEATGKTLAAIEVHKAIVKRNPAYFNSYLRLACIAVDCGSLNECAKWLKIAAAAAPGNSEVLTLIGNLHLSLCDWKPAQNVFDGLMAKKIPSVEAYSALSMGNIYFANLYVAPERYSKHLQYASDYYKRILNKDPLNAYAANGIGTVLAEKGEVFKAKEVFNHVREVSGDGIADTLLNLGHIYLAQKKHPEALQMYKSYMKRAEDGTTPITSKSRLDDVVDVLLYIAFAYFDWARHTELFNDANAAPADERYKLAMTHLELAIKKRSKKEVILKYNLCMTKLQAANCVLQKLTRNIPRTVQEVQEALAGLKESLSTVEEILRDKEEGKKKINIRTSMLEDFLKHCRANISSAESHLNDEQKRAAEEADEREIRRLAAEAALKEQALREAIRKAEEAKKQEERDQKAEAKMRQVEELRVGWQHEQAVEAEKAKKLKKKPDADQLEEEDVAPVGHGLFYDSEDEDDLVVGEKEPRPVDEAKKQAEREMDAIGLVDSDDDDDDKNNKNGKPSKAKSDTGEKESPANTNKDIFGESEDDESDDELLSSDQKRGSGEVGNDDEDGDDQPKKKRRVLEDD